MPDQQPLSERDRTLRDRAKALAAVPATAPADTFNVLVFELAHERYAVDLAFVREVYPLKDLVAVPCTPGFVLGIINLRGEICPVMDLRLFFGLPQRGLTNATRAVVLSAGAREFGIVADVVQGLRAIEKKALLAPPTTFAGIHVEFLLGIADGGLIVLDAERILAHPSMVVREYVSESTVYTA